MQLYKPLNEEQRESEAISLFALNSKNLQATHTWKFVTLPNIFLQKEKKITKFWFTPFHSTFGTPSAKYFYCFN